MYEMKSTQKEFITRIFNCNQAAQLISSGPDMRPDNK